MRILELINDYKEKKIMNTAIDKDAVSNYLKKTLEVKDYLAFAEKRELCERVVNSCNHKDINSGLIKVDSVMRYIVFTVTILSTYTNLEFSTGEDFDSLDEYDMLCQADLLNPILDVIGAEYATCNNILNMMMDDVIANNNTIENVLDNAADRLLGSIDTFVDVLAEKVKDLNLDLSQFDIEQFAPLLDKLGGKIK